MLTKLSKHHIGLIAAVMALSACSSEDAVIDESNARNEITFNVTTNGAARANVYYNSTSPVTRFRVSAWAKQGDNTDSSVSGINKSYFDCDSLTLKDSKWTYDDGHTRYWPNNGEKLDFYAWVDYDNDNKSKGYTFAWTGTPNDRASLTGIAQLANAADIVDLLYGNEFDNKQNVNSTASSSKVTIAMNHAFSQIGVIVKVANPKIQVQVSEVALVNLIGQADFKFAANAAQSTEADKAGWTEGTGTQTVTAVVSPAVQINASDTDGKNLTGTDNTFMVLPHSGYNTADATATSITMTDSKPASGTYIGLKCKVWNIAAASGAANGDMIIHGTASADKYLFVPVALDCDMGKHYTYTLTFGNGHAGFNEDGANTLVAVDWTVTDPEEWVSAPQSAGDAESTTDTPAAGDDDDNNE